MHFLFTGSRNSVKICAKIGWKLQTDCIVKNIIGFRVQNTIFGLESAIEIVA